MFSEIIIFYEDNVENIIIIYKNNKGNEKNDFFNLNNSFNPKNHLNRDLK